MCRLLHTPSCPFFFFKFLLLQLVNSLCQIIYRKKFVSLLHNLICPTRIERIHREYVFWERYGLQAEIKIPPDLSYLYIEVSKLVWDFLGAKIHINCKFVYNWKSSWSLSDMLLGLFFWCYCLNDEARFHI